jgi:hypothetical protein
MSLNGPVNGRLSALLAGVLFASIAVVAAPASAQTSQACQSGSPVLQVGNPNPGDVLSQGDYIFSGVAFDPAATDGSGITRVDLFLGDRDSGGLLLASAAPGLSHQYETRGTVPTTMTGSHDFVAYAYSSLTGQQTSVSVPIYVGPAPTPTPSGSTAPTPVPLTETTQSTCPAPSAAFQPLPMSVARIAPVLSLGNPNAGDLVPFGDVFVDGIAYDPSASTGDGVDSVELFLDSRDSGGTLVGSGVPAADHSFKIKTTLHTNNSGSHNFFAYAHSSVTGQETVTEVPVFVGISPTATPRPTN